MVKRQRIFPVFYLLFAYVILQFAWWAYSILRLNAEIINLRSELAQLQGGSAEQIQAIERAMESKMIMVAGEGSVFFILLLAGAFYILRSFRREMAVQSQQKNFMLSVTHELKSPLASVKLYLQTLLKRELNHEKQKEITRQALSDTDRLGTLIDNILTASRIDGGHFSLHLEEENLGQFLQKIALLQIPNGFSTHSLELDLQPNVVVPIDKQALTIILSNLLENAVKYSPVGTTIRLVMSSEKGLIQLKVIDQGPGIPVSEREMVFQKFYRIGNEDTRKSKGTGLGLYIVKTLCLLHNIEISIENPIQGGSIFKLEWK